MTNDELIKVLQTVSSKEGRSTWHTVRGTAIVFATFAFAAISLLFWALLTLLQEGDKVEAHWTVIGGIIGYIGGLATAFGAIAHLRADESPPQMPVDVALRFIQISRQQGIEDATLEHTHKDVTGTK